MVERASFYIMMIMQYWYNSIRSIWIICVVCQANSVYNLFHNIWFGGPELKFE